MLTLEDKGIFLAKNQNNTPRYSQEHITKYISFLKILPLPPVTSQIHGLVNQKSNVMTF